MKKLRFFLCIAMATLWNTWCLGHGVEHTVIEGGVGIEVSYADGTPMNYSDVTVFSPLDSATEFQQGLTDKNGRFVFFPDATGAWRVTVDDGMGHAVSTDIEIREGMSVGVKEPPRFSRLQGIIIGVSVIFGIFGISSWFCARKRLKG